MSLLSIVTPCYNEEENVEELYCQVNKVLATLDGYSFDGEYIGAIHTQNQKLPLVIEKERINF